MDCHNGNVYISSSAGDEEDSRGCVVQWQLTATQENKTQCLCVHTLVGRHSFVGDMTREESLCFIYYRVKENGKSERGSMRARETGRKGQRYTGREGLEMTAEEWLCFIKHRETEQKGAEDVAKILTNKT